VLFWGDITWHTTSLLFFPISYFFISLRLFPKSLIAILTFDGVSALSFCSNNIIWNLSVHNILIIYQSSIESPRRTTAPLTYFRHLFLSSFPSFFSFYGRYVDILLIDYIFGCTCVISSHMVSFENLVSIFSICDEITIEIANEIEARNDVHIFFFLSFGYQHEIFIFVQQFIVSVCYPWRVWQRWICKQNWRGVDSWNLRMRTARFSHPISRFMYLLYQFLFRFHFSSFWDIHSHDWAFNLPFGRF